MMKYQIRTSNDLIAYLCECSLATVDHLAGLKRKSKHEFERQISIAQFNIDKGLEFGVDFSDTRAHDIIKDYGGSVEKWSKRHDTEKWKND